MLLEAGGLCSGALAADARAAGLGLRDRSCFKFKKNNATDLEPELTSKPELRVSPAGPVRVSRSL